MKQCNYFLSENDSELKDYLSSIICPCCLSYEINIQAPIKAYEFTEYVLFFRPFICLNNNCSLSHKPYIGNIVYKLIK